MADPLETRDGVPTIRYLKPLLVLSTLVLVFACLAIARDVLIPVALASLLALVLTPLVTLVQRRGVHRIAAVILVVLVAFSVLGGALWVLAQQVTTLANDLPQYRHNVRQKVAEVRLFRRGGSIGKVQDTVSDVVGEIQKGGPQQPSAAPPPPERPAWPVPTTAGAIAEMAAIAGFVIVLVVFMLIERQELRNRIVRLFGRGRVTVTTKAIDEATQGIIRYLLLQSLVNTCFGAAVAVGLFLIGVPYALLWGVLAGMLRFIPYVGTWMAALLPITMSLAVFPGWTKPLIVIALFAVLEPFIYAVVEPLLYGHSIGVSQTALLVAVAFWTWLWGPVGLILATPLTVCLVVIGKYVPDLDFILTLVTDRPVLTPDVAYYQRLVAMDQDEAAEIAEAQLHERDTVRLYDGVMLPALTYARRDRARGRLTEEEVRSVARMSREIIEGATSPDAPPTVRAHVLGCAAADGADEVALRMLADVVAPWGVEIDQLAADTLTAEVVTRVEERRPACICVAALPPGGMAHTRYLLKRLRARFPDACIVVGRWGAADDEEEAPLLAAGADRVGRTLAVTRDHILELLPGAQNGARAHRVTSR
jgi:predicted PurR-regulated permease PerM